MKPKLVARSTRTETSPWKTNKNAPRILPAEVPESLRPLLSYTLWRIYDNIITRADSKASIILSGSKEICDTARKLSISAVSIGELRETIRSQKAAVDLNIFGDLERDFGVRIFADRPSQSGDTHAAPDEQASLYKDYPTIMEEKSSDTNQLNDSCGTNLTGTSIHPTTTECNDREKVNLIPAEDAALNEFIEPFCVDVEQEEMQPDSCESPSSMEAIASSTSSEKSLSVLTEQHGLPAGEDKLWIAVDEPEILTKQVSGLPGPDSALFSNHLPMLEPQFFSKEHNKDYHQKTEPECPPEKTNGIQKQEPGPFTHGVNALALMEPELVSGAASANSERPELNSVDKKAHGLQKTKPDVLAKRFSPSSWKEPEHHIKDLHRRRPKKAYNARENSTRQLLPIKNIDAAPEMSNIVIPRAGADNITTKDSNSSGKIVLFKEPQTSQLPASRSQNYKSPRNSHSNNKAKPNPSHSPNTPSTAPAQVASVQIAPSQVPPAHFPLAQDASDPYDSDEEVVVFSPKAKRLSAQKNPPKQINSRPPSRGNHVHTSPQVKAPLIDPDAFGRSDAIGPPSVVTSRTQVQNWQYSRYSPRGNPRHVSRTNEQEVDFVLKSGSPRGTSRGHGKLWVP